MLQGGDASGPGVAGGAVEVGSGTSVAGEGGSLTLGQQGSRRTHHHHRFRRPARREQPADGVHWAHYPRECARSQTPREQVPVTHA